MVVSKLILKAYYSIDGEYLPFPDNPLHDKTFENVDVEVKNEIRTLRGIEFEVTVIEIAGQEPIECELCSMEIKGADLILHICQDWG